MWPYFAPLVADFCLLPAKINASIFCALSFLPLFRGFILVSTDEKIYSKLGKEIGLKLMKIREITILNVYLRNEFDFFQCYRSINYTGLHATTQCSLYFDKPRKNQIHCLYLHLFLRRI